MIMIDEENERALDEALFPRSSTTPARTTQKKTKSKTTENTDNEQWKRKYFDSVENIGKLRSKTDAMDSEMHRYVLFLKATALERKIGSFFFTLIV